MTIASIHARPQPNEYRNAILDLAHTRQRWAEVREADLLPLYDLLMRDAPGDAWASLTNHDDGHSEGASALYAIRQAIFCGDPPLAARRAMAIFQANISAYFDDKIRGDLQDVWAEHRVSDRRELEAADYRARVRDAM